MITITNVSKHHCDTGWHQYELRINGELICRFQHRREDGLSACLLQAAGAVNAERDKRLSKIHEQIDIARAAADAESIKP